MEGDRRGAELDEVEVGVAADQRVERPRHPRQTVSDRPRPLVLLEGEPDVAAAQSLGDAGDVAVQVRAAVIATEQAERSADDLGTRDGHRPVGVDVGQGANDLGGNDRLVVVIRPDLRQQPGHAVGTSSASRIGRISTLGSRRRGHGSCGRLLGELVGGSRAHRPQCRSAEPAGHRGVPTNVRRGLVPADMSSATASGAP